MNHVDIFDIRLGDVIELYNGIKVEVTSLTIKTGDTVGFRINPNSLLESSVDICDVKKIYGYVRDGITYDLRGNKIKNYFED